MPSTLKTPGVYVEEIVKFPPSVAQVETAIPAFIGYTEKATKKIDGDLSMVPTRITSLLEYETFFGGARAETTIEVTVTDDKDGNQSIVVSQPKSKEPFLMYYSMQLYFANGGGPCYITSVGDYSGIVSLDVLEDGLDEVAKVDEPTLILFPDATRASGVTRDTFYALYDQALKQCQKLQDRFTIIDTLSYDGTSSVDQNVIDLREKISSEKDVVKYGAAYYPHLETILNYTIDPERIIITHVDNGSSPEAADTITGNVTSIDTSFSGKVDDVVANLGTFATDGFTGLLADVLDYLYNDDSVPANEGFNIGDADDNNKNFDAPRPATLVEKLEDLLDGLEDLVTLKDKAKVEGNATKSALVGELTVGELTTIQTNIDALVNLFEGDDKIEDKIEALSKLTNSLKKAIADGTDAEGLKDIIEDNDSNILDALEGFLDAAFDYETPADALPTSFDDIITNWETLRDNINAQIIKDTNNGSMHGRSLSTLEAEDNSTYNLIKVAINNLPMELPPSSAIAGVYARIDSTRGVWKAPANVSLSYVIKPTVRVTNDIQDGLNVDTTAGKSINAIRSFTGKGVMVWGARTLAGNDNEWRYVSVRRFFNMVEESVKKASDQFVFEANDANTWVRIRSMIENFLTNQWKAGALAGATTDEAYYVKVGLNQTMTADDILNGIMNIEIGMAVVRPAEFIVLKFSHKMQES
ncbi:phage tail sheath C-terminal domain-containing protein [Kordia zhangzhouensis]|uniref:phage tail sheath C-terminal domain-containing protein n=1 Tax=Kordia zhangzhouensis TaxID=1620405 RepID=UPI000629267D|nr:phage tail sheath C-terminal domain-containing protein [Kordia zhangzhouensis]